MTPREEKKDRTRTALASAAIKLFTDHGYDTVTVADVAEAAGVSRRTAFRYFPSKDDLVMEVPGQWMRVLDESLLANQDLPLSQRLREATSAVAAHIESDPEPVTQLFALAFEHPSLAASYAQSSQAFIERVAVEMSDGQQGSDGDRLRITVLAAAYMGMVDGVCAIWAQSGGSMNELFDAGFEALEAGLTSLD